MQRPLVGTVIALVSLAAALPGCAASQPAWEDDFAAPETPAASQPVKPRSPPGRFARAEVDEVLLQGPSWILRRIVADEVIRDGAFVGWRIAALPEEWSHLAIKPGDVVTRVNGAPLERPDDLWAAWAALASAKELKITYEREGAARDLTMPIDGAPTGEVVARLQSNAPPPRPSRPPKGTIVIEEGAPPGSADIDDNTAPGGPTESVSVSGSAKGSGAKEASPPGGRDAGKKK
jgi:hypothetical protein